MISPITKQLKAERQQLQQLIMDSNKPEKCKDVNLQESNDPTYTTDNVEPEEMDIGEDDYDQTDVASGSASGAGSVRDRTQNIDRSTTINRNIGEHTNHNNNNNNNLYNKSDGHKVERDGDMEDGLKGLQTNIVQVTNVAPSATLEQMSTLFGFLGDIINIELYHSNQNSDTNFKVCFVEFAKPSSVFMAQHLTNTVFIDRALIVLPYNKHKIPDRETALASVANSDIANSFNSGFVSQAISAIGGAQVTTIDPRLTALGLPPYPQLATADPARIEEIRRTLYIGNLDSTIPPDQVLKFFNDIGEVKYIRMAGDDTQPTRFAFVEFTHQSSVANALQHNGYVLGSRSLKINHSNNAIVKPKPKVEPEDVSKKLSELHSASRERHQSARYDRGHERIREHERDRDRDRDRSRYHDRGRVSPIRESKSRRTRSRERDSSSRRRSRSRERPLRRSRSREKSSKRRSRSRDSRRRHSRSRSIERSRSRHHHKSSSRR